MVAPGRAPSTFGFWGWAGGVGGALLQLPRPTADGGVEQTQNGWGSPERGGT
jgi:hypothetical protein